MPNRTKTDGERERGCIKGPNLVHFHCNDRRLISAREIFRPLHSSSVTEGRRARRRASERKRKKEPSRTDPYAVDRYGRGREGEERSGGKRGEIIQVIFFPKFVTIRKCQRAGRGGSGSGFNGAAWSTPLKSMNYETTH